MNVTLVIVLIVYFVGLIAIGAYFTRRASRDYGEFMIGERKIGPWASAFSAVSSFMSGYTYTAAPGLGYTQGYGALWWSAGEAPGNSLGFGLLGRRLRKVTGLIDAISIPEFYEKYFASPILRLLTSIVLIFLISAYLVAQWIAAGNLLDVILGVDYVVGVLIVAGVVLLYTLLGGYLAVVYNDSIQMVIMFVGTQLFFWIALFNVGGLAELNNSLAAVNPDFVTPWGPNLMYFGIFAALSPVLLLALSGFGLPHVVVRHISMNNSRTARQAMLITAVLVVLFSPVYFMTGLLGLAYFGPGIENVEQVGIRMWVDMLPPVIAGVLSSAALAAIMSTASSFLILLVTTIGHDVLYRFAMPESSERKRILIARTLVVIITIVTFIVALNPPGLVFEIVVIALGTLVLSFAIPNLFTMFWRRTTKVGVISCIVLSLIVYGGLSLAGSTPFGLDPFIVGLIVAIGSIVLGSWISPDPSADQLAVFDVGASYAADVPPRISANESTRLSYEINQALDLIDQSRDAREWRIGPLTPGPADG